MHRRVPQPPVEPRLRDLEQHRFAPAAIIAAIGLVLTCGGAVRRTGVPIIDGGTASEPQLIRGFAHTGVQYADKLPPPEPPRLDDPNTAAIELERWAQQQAAAAPGEWKVRVDPRAAARCPT